MQPLTDCSYTTGQCHSQGAATIKCKQTHPTCKEDMTAKGKSPEFGLLGTANVELVTNSMCLWLTDMIWLGAS